jgi:hypothetical protein
LVNMRDLIAGVLALALLVLAASLATTLHYYRRRRQFARDSERALGRRVIAELPLGEDLTLFSEDDARFYCGDRHIDKDVILAVRVLINGAPIAAATAPRSHQASLQPTAFEDRPDGIARDRWDVAIETETGPVLVECGAIRERVSQELARKIFDAVKASLTTQSPGSQHDG